MISGTKAESGGLGGTCPSVRSLGSEPWDLQPRASRCSANMRLAPQPFRGGKRNRNIPGNDKQSRADLCQTKAVGLGRGSPDVGCTSASSINASNGLLVLLGPHHRHRPGHHRTLEPRREAKGPWRRLRKTCLLRKASFQLFLSLRFRTAAKPHPLQLLASGPGTDSVLCFSPLNHSLAACRLMRDECGAPFLVLLQQRGPACSLASLRLSGTNQQRARH